MDPAKIVRYENKYLIDEQVAQAIAAAIRPVCSRDENAGERGYIIHSLYFDTLKSDFYYANNDKYQVRFKPRVRTYDEQCPWVWLELKAKIGDKVSKSRVKLPMSEWPAILDRPRNQVDPRLLRKDAFLHIVDRYQCVPACHIRYRREAFVSEIDNYVRITFDRDICATPPEGSPYLEFHERAGRAARMRCDDAVLMTHECTRSPVILEIKCETLAPYWILALIAQFRLQQRGVSKYILGRELMRQTDHRVSTYQRAFTRRFERRKSA